ncbi:endoplasmic reticulum-Golgi intermediate compartment protein 3 [Paragonimus westermani]|uniref:Endoplasmic reticulum-Golgi intermediate compartment protein 3 n=1 Tax=Paragonimus westermani TaxID=34504 RepID=A0A5J4NIA0_9TREM|nr:endoplasmic reticulum-Golgi intermediate compartment protein 3 [Paragonimus westermani]
MFYPVFVRITDAKLLCSVLYDLILAFQMITYYMKLVPTIYIRHKDSIDAMDTVESNQYSVTWHSKGTPLNGNGQGIPGLFFNYEISPILVKISQEHKSFMHFLTNTCAIIGGVFTGEQIFNVPSNFILNRNLSSSPVASLVDAFIYHSTCVVRKRFSEHSH